VEAILSPLGSWREMRREEARVGVAKIFHKVSSLPLLRFVAAFGSRRGRRCKESLRSNVRGAV
jgi:hypothetical protein